MPCGKTGTSNQFGSPKTVPATGACFDSAGGLVRPVPAVLLSAYARSCVALGGKK
jgi:hypothetical protein